MTPLLELLCDDARLSTKQMAERLGLSEAAVEGQLSDLLADGIVLGFHAVIDPEKISHQHVAALIEVKLTPERDGGFDRMAQRIAKFDQVTSCYLMSGGYDLAVFVEGHDLREFARSLSEKLSTLEGVVSTATHFQLKVYKQSGFLATERTEPERLSVTP